MSTTLAIAGVAAILRDMLANRFGAEPVASAVGPVTVSSLPPDRIDLSGAADPTQCNVFLHQVSQNLGWTNFDLPIRDARGDRVASPPLALDLHFLITSYGAAPLLAEILMGQTAQLFHETPVPTRAIIERALTPGAPPPAWPAGMDAIGLADQIERLKITPEALSNEEISKLWSALQARYRPTLAFRVTTVLIESDLPTRRALPTRMAFAGASGQARPRIDTVRALAGLHTPVLAGTEIEVLGGGLAAGDMILRVDGQDLTATLTVRTADRLVFTLPNPLPAGTQPGAVPVTIAHRAPFGEPATLREVAVSNPGILVLTPTVTATFAQSASVVVDGVTLRDGTLTLTMDPAIGRDQSLAVFLNALDGSGRSVSVRAPVGNGVPVTTPETTSVNISLAEIVAGSYLLRVQVDAGESALAQAADGTFTGPQVVI